MPEGATVAGLLQVIMSQTAVWKISLSNLSRNLLEATELANVLQEVSSSIQVTGLSSSLSGRTSTSTSGTPTKLSTRERIKNAVPVHIGVGAVPWEQLVAVVPSDALHDHSSFDQADKQPQVVEVNTGGTVFFLFFRLNRKQQQQYQQQHQQADHGRRVSSSSSNNSVLAGRPPAGSAASPAGAQIDADICADFQPMAASKGAAAGSMRRGLPREGIAVLKVGFSRLAMQAEQFANELTRHLGIAAPDCRIVRQVGSTADEWTTALDAVNRVVGCSCPPHSTAQAAAAAAAAGHTSSSSGGSSQQPTAGGSSGGAKLPHVRISSSSGPAQHVIQPSVDHHVTSSINDSSMASCAAGTQTAANTTATNSSSTGMTPGASSSTGSAAAWYGDGQTASASCPHCGASCAIATAGPGAAELLGELSHLPCFLLMEFVEGGRLSDSPQALQSGSVGQLLEDVGCLFLLDMLLGNADRMPCADLGWRGNANNLLYGAPGTRHEGRPVAIDSCVARRPPALKASTEDAAVERLAQLLLSVPEVSRSLLQQLLGNIKQDPGCCTRLSLADSGSGDVAGWGQQQHAADDAAPVDFSDEDVARFQAGLRKCLHGVTQIKGLLEMVSNKVAEWIADFVADVVKLNPAVLPGPGTPGTPPTAVLRSPRPSPRPSARSLFLQANMAVSGSAGGAGSSGGQPPLHQQQHGAGSVGAPHSPRPSPRSTSSSNLRLHASSGGGQPPLPLPPPAFQPQQQHGLGSNGGLGSPKPSPRSSVRSLSFHASTGGATGSLVGLPPLPTSQQQQQQPEPAADRPSIAVLPAATGAAGLNSTSGTVKHEAGVQGAGATAAPDGAADVMHSSSASMDSSSCNTGSRSSSGSPNPHAPILATSGPGPESDNSTQCSPKRSSGSVSYSSAACDMLSPLSPRGNCGASSNRNAVEGCAEGPASGSKHIQSSLKSLAKHFSPASKALPLARRAASHLGFASIKAAICSTDSSSTDSSPADAPAGTPPALHISSGRPSSSSNNSMGGAGCHADVATAVAAALSPKATQAQTQALVGVFGGGAYMAGVDGSLCVRRATWNSMDEHHTPTRESPRDLLLAAAAEGACSGPTDSRRAASCITPAGAMQFPLHSSNENFGYHQQQQATHVSRHSSFPVHSQSVAAAATAAAATVVSPVQQRCSSSSLQVLASIQLDATLASIKHEAKHDGALAERLSHWKAVFREKGAELSEAIASWQARHHLAVVLSTGFLDGSHPIVDAYELGVRLQHMLRRLTALAAGALVQVPICVLPGVFLGNAVAADSHHLLHHLGVTHVVNAAQELQVESAPGLFQLHRVAIRDEEEEEISHHFYEVQALIDSALTGGGAVLVHCHEGKSRSVALLLAYLMISRGHTLASALAHIRSVRPEACPNAGFMAQLMVLDRQLHGSTSLSKADLPRAKPEARICSICGQPAGLSYASLVRHLKSTHKVALAASVVAGSRHAGAASAVNVHTGNAAAATVTTPAETEP